MRILGLALFILASQNQALAWEKHGHALVCEAAAYAISDTAPFLKDHSFDIGYYCNVPDVIWKRPDTYKIEREEHFVDLEIFKRAMGDNGVWIKDRTEFFKKYPAAKEAGSAYWRISEICEDLGKLKDKLASKDLKDQKKVQLEWLTRAGTLGHYVGDIAQPLHTTENYDGQMTGQKGVHAFYEGDIANEIYPDITSAVFNRVRIDFKSMQNKNELSCFDLARELAEISYKEIPALLETDKKIGRADMKKAVEANQAAIVKQLARGSVYLALIWSKYLGFKFNSDKFHEFDESPKYLAPVGKVR